MPVRSSLPLLVTGIGTDDKHHSATADDLALVAHANAAVRFDAPVAVLHHVVHFSNPLHKKKAATATPNFHFHSGRSGQAIPATDLTVPSEQRKKSIFSLEKGSSAL
jgi:hypothetical protein